jgi:hypothetical protein
MGVQYNVGGLEEQTGFVADKALYLNAARTKVVEATDPDASYLLAGIGGHVDEATAKRYKLGGLTKVSDLKRLPNGEYVPGADPEDDEELIARGFGLHLAYTRGVEKPTEMAVKMEENRKASANRAERIATGDSVDPGDAAGLQGLPTDSPHHPLNAELPESNANPDNERGAGEQSENQGQTQTEEEEETGPEENTKPPARRGH